MIKKIKELKVAYKQKQYENELCNELINTELMDYSYELTMKKVVELTQMNHDVDCERFINIILKKINRPLNALETWQYEKQLIFITQIINNLTDVNNQEKYMQRICNELPIECSLFVMENYLKQSKGLENTNKEKILSYLDFSKYKINEKNKNSYLNNYDKRKDEYLVIKKNVSALFNVLDEQNCEYSDLIFKFLKCIKCDLRDKKMSDVQNLLNKFGNNQRGMLMQDAIESQDETYCFFMLKYVIDDDKEYQQLMKKVIEKYDIWFVAKCGVNIKDTLEIREAIYDSKDIDIITTYCNNQSDIEITQYFQQRIIKENNRFFSEKFAIRVNNANIKELTQVMFSIDSNYNDYMYYLMKEYFNYRTIELNRYKNLDIYASNKKVNKYSRYKRYTEFKQAMSYGIITEDIIKEYQLDDFDYYYFIKNKNKQISKEQYIIDKNIITNEVNMNDIAELLKSNNIELVYEYFKYNKLLNHPELAKYLLEKKDANWLFKYIEQTSLYGECVGNNKNLTKDFISKAVQIIIESDNRELILDLMHYVKTPTLAKAVLKTSDVKFCLDIWNNYYSEFTMEEIRELKELIVQTHDFDLYQKFISIFHCKVDMQPDLERAANLDLIKEMEANNYKYTIYDEKKTKKPLKQNKIKKESNKRLSEKITGILTNK